MQCLYINACTQNMSYKGSSGSFINNLHGWHACCNLLFSNLPLIPDDKGSGLC